MKLTDIIPNENNPRYIKDDRFKKLVTSISEFPKMMELRPIIIDKDNVILGGNMRYAALEDLKYENIPDNWVRRADELTDDEKRRFIISDNVGFGEWDWDALANEWDEKELTDWGLELPLFDDFSDKNNEIDTDDFSDKMTLKFELSEGEYSFITELLAKIDANKETALLKTLGYES